MKRIEIIGNKSVEDDLFDQFNKLGVTNVFTKIPVVHGIGKSGPRMGDHIWPEENFLVIIYCEKEEAEKVIDAVKNVKELFFDEGLKLFEMEVDCCI